jgi:hypothetical protein
MILPVSPATFNTPIRPSLLQPEKSLRPTLFFSEAIHRCLPPPSPYPPAGMPTAPLTGPIFFAKPPPLDLITLN